MEHKSIIEIPANPHRKGGPHDHIYDELKKDGQRLSSDQDVLLWPLPISKPEEKPEPEKEE